MKDKEIDKEVKENMRPIEKKYVCVGCWKEFDEWLEAKTHYETKHPKRQFMIYKKDTLLAKNKRIDELRGIESPTTLQQPVPVEHDKARLSLASERGKVDHKKSIVKEVIEHANALAKFGLASKDKTKILVEQAVDEVLVEGELDGSRKRFEEKLRIEVKKIVEEEVTKQVISSDKLELILKMVKDLSSKPNSNVNEMMKADLLHRISYSLKPEQPVPSKIDVKLFAKEFWDEWERREEKRLEETPAIPVRIIRTKKICKSYVEIAEIYLKEMRVMKPDGAVVDHEWVMTTMDFAKWLDDHKFERD